MILSPYLNFDGNASQAIHYYAEKLGGVVEFEQKFGDMPGAAEMDFVTDANRDRLAHGSLRLGERLLMVSDTAGNEPHGGFSGATLNLSYPDVDAARAGFDALAGEGEIVMPFAPTFWSPGFGMLRDRFGVQWMFTCDH